MVESAELYQKSYLAAGFGSTPKKDLAHYFRHPKRGLPLIGQLFRRQKRIKGLKAGVQSGILKADRQDHDCQAFLLSFAATK